jgi:hypothetical protein
MKSLMRIAVLMLMLMLMLMSMLMSMAAYAQGGKPCEDLKAEIGKKIEANGVKTYSLEIVAKDKEPEADAKVVGTCEGGSKKIVYRKNAAAPQAPAKETSKP